MTSTRPDARTSRCTPSSGCPAAPASRSLSVDCCRTYLVTIICRLLADYSPIFCGIMQIYTFFRIIPFPSGTFCTFCKKSPPFWALDSALPPLLPSLPGSSPLLPRLSPTLVLQILPPARQNVTYPKSNRGTHYVFASVRPFLQHHRRQAKGHSSLPSRRSRHSRLDRESPCTNDKILQIILAILVFFNRGGVNLSLELVAQSIYYQYDTKIL